MSPQDLFGVAVRTVGLVFATAGLTLFLSPLFGSLGGFLVGMALVLMAEPMARAAYRPFEGLSAAIANWWKDTIGAYFPPKQP